jgi:hypothetical protein
MGMLNKCVGGRIILKRNFEKCDGGKDRVDLAQNKEKVTGSFECGNEPLGSIKCGEFLD